MATREPEYGNMEGKKIRYSVREQEIHLNKSNKNVSSYLSTIMIRANLKGELTATQERVFYNATPDEKGRVTHIRDSKTGHDLLHNATVSVYANGQSGKFNPYAKENMKPLPSEILLMLEDD